MQPLHHFKTKIQFLLTDIDDTLTTHGQLLPESYEALWLLKNAGIKVIPVTGRPAGWCDMIARFWPVDGVIGENGGLYYRYTNRQMKRWNFFSEADLKINRSRLEIIAEKIKTQVPRAQISADQFCRQYDLAIDFCEDIPKLCETEINQIVQIFNSDGAHAKVSSIHVNGWFGNFNKVSTAMTLLQNEFHLSNDQILATTAYVGDSPNDEPLFEKFIHTFGVANIKNFEKNLTYLPQFVSQSDGGNGFCEIAHHIIQLLKS